MHIEPSLMNKPLIPLGLVLFCAGAFALIVACGDDDEVPAEGTETSPSASAGPTQAANLDAIESARVYLKEEGVDGQKGDFTDPLNCSRLNQDSPGRFCVHDTFSTYAPGLVILVIGDKEGPDEQTWEVRLEPGESDWQVTTAKPRSDQTTE